MELSIQKWGNSAAIRLPVELLKLLQIAAGDKLEVEVRAGALILKPKRASYSLAELVAQCAPNAPAPADVSAWTETRPAASEAW